MHKLSTSVTRCHARASLCAAYAHFICSTSERFARGLPTIASLQNYRPPQVSRIVDRKGHLIAARKALRKGLIEIDDRQDLQAAGQMPSA